LCLPAADASSIKSCKSGGKCTTNPCLHIWQLLHHLVVAASLTHVMRKSSSAEPWTHVPHACTMTIPWKLDSPTTHFQVDQPFHVAHQEDPSPCQEHFNETKG
jgi:hypothetical protein